MDRQFTKLLDLVQDVASGERYRFSCVAVAAVRELDTDSAYANDGCPSVLISIPASLYAYHGEITQKDISIPYTDA